MNQPKEIKKPEKKDFELLEPEKGIAYGYWSDKYKDGYNQACNDYEAYHLWAMKQGINSELLEALEAFLELTDTNFPEITTDFHDQCREKAQQAITNAEKELKQP